MPTASFFGQAQFPEKTWPQIKGRINRISADYGFTELTLIHD
ncbi:hypothetical protein [Kineosporia sp. NBRC 101731]|nr:hypothetical protein [Kineosporia sp. NBRC 101731]GLY28898.1 hypothetical protein Kisp02_22630 [Kineosporia sp. NBRC 101731]